MQNRLWLASAAAVTMVATAAFVAGPTLHGQAPQVPGSDTTHDAATLERDIDRAVRQALDQAGLRNGELSLDLRQTIEAATRTAQDAVKDLDVKVIVDDAMQDMPGMAMLGSRPRLGVNTRDVSADEARAAGLDGIIGAYVSDVSAESAAGKAGLQAKDIIVTVDGETIRSARQLARVISESPEGRALQVTYVRGTARSTVAVTPEVRAPRAMTWERRGSAPRGGPDGPERGFDMVRPPEGPGGPGGQQFFFRQGPGGNVRVWSGRGRLGVVAQPLTDQLAAYFGVKEGALVTQVTDASAAAKAGIKAGDVITAVNGKPVKDTGDIIDHLQGVENGKAVPVDDHARQEGADDLRHSGDAVQHVGRPAGPSPAAVHGITARGAELRPPFVRLLSTPP